MAGYIGSKGSGIISGIDASIADLNLTDKASANGTTEANKVLTADGNKDVTAIRNLTATGDATVGGSVTATGTVTRALTRGSIDVGNSSGVSSALAKGAAGTVLTSDGTDLSFVAASGGGEQTFTATGAITAGNLVGLTSSGTISVAEAELQAAVAIGSGSAASSTASTYLVYDTANDKVLLFFKGTSNYLYGRVGTIANGQISFGTAATTGVTAGFIHAAYDVNSGKTVVSYNQNSGSNSGMAVVATVSGTSLSFGTPVTLRSSGSNNVKVEYDSNAQKVLFIYDGSVTYGRVGTVSGTTVSLGTEAQVSTYDSAYQTADITFDTTANKFVLSYTRNAMQVPSFRVLTISGTSVSGGTEITGSGSLVSATVLSHVTYIPSINKTAFVGSYVGAYYYYHILTVSGTDITATAGVQFDGDLPIANGSNYIIVAGNKTFMQFFETGNYNTLIEIGVGATEITFAPLSEKVRWTAGATAATHDPRAVYDPDTGSLVNGGATDVRVLNVTAPAFVGIAAENISDGATGKVTVAGGINTSVSGLTTGKSYGLTASSGSLTLSGVDRIGEIGIALSSSSIYLNVGKL